MLKTFNCPACSGPLDYTRDAGKVITCRFCGQSVMVPKQVQEPSAKETPMPSGRSRRWVAMPVVIILGVAAWMFFMNRSTPAPSSSGISSVPAPSLPAAPTPPPAGQGFQVALSFGEEGIGPGGFEDARHIALDGDGYIYVAEYSGGRIQRFDATGRFMTQWLVDTEQVVRGMAADRNGIVYIVQRGKIQRYQGATGEALGTWSAPFWIDGIYPAADGGLLAFGGGASPAQVVRINAQGQAQEAFQTQARNARAALDGLGNTYVLGGFSERGKRHVAVLKYDLSGTYLNRFGGLGDEPGQFRAPHAIAVDGRERIYVSDFSGIEVFDSEGRYLGNLDLGPSIFGMIFNDQNELFVVERNAHRVVKVILP